MQNSIQKPDAVVASPSECAEQQSASGSISKACLKSSQNRQGDSSKRGSYENFARILVDLLALLMIFMWHCGSMNRRNGRCFGIQIIWNMEEMGVERNTSQINGQLEGDGRVFFEFDEFAGGILFSGLLPTFKSLV